jgi:hypothetical protein
LFQAPPALLSPSATTTTAPAFAAPHYNSFGSERIVVTDQHHLDRPTEVLGIVDVHLAMGTEEAALGELRNRAAELGADAVLGVEFHHGEHKGEPIHLSGLAVRFMRTLP